MILLLQAKDVSCANRNVPASLDSNGTEIENNNFGLSALRKWCFSTSFVMNNVGYLFVIVSLVVFGLGCIIYIMKGWILIDLISWFRFFLLLLLLMFFCFFHIKFNKFNSFKSSVFYKLFVDHRLVERRTRKKKQIVSNFILKFNEIKRKKQQKYNQTGILKHSPVDIIAPLIEKEDGLV